MSLQHPIRITLADGRVLQLDSIAEELFRLFLGALHSDMFHKEGTGEPFFISYAFIGQALIWRYKLCSEEDFKIYKSLSLAAQYLVATRWVATMYEIVQLPLTTNKLLEELEKMLGEANESND